MRRNNPLSKQLDTIGRRTDRTTIQSATPGTRYMNLCASCMISLQPMILTGYIPGGSDACNECRDVSELAICKVNAS